MRLFFLLASSMNTYYHFKKFIPKMFSTSQSKTNT